MNCSGRLSERSAGLAGFTRTRTFRGTPASVPEARRFVDDLLAGCPARETLVTCVSELCANAIAHTTSGQGGIFLVEVDCSRAGVARVAVTDQGGASVPVKGGCDLMAEGGRGLAMVAACTSRWGFADVPSGRVVWAEAAWPVGMPSPKRKAAPLSWRQPDPGNLAFDKGSPMTKVITAHSGDEQ